MTARRQPARPSQDDFPKLANPARRALANAGIRQLTDLANLTEAEFGRLHGIGPNAIAALKASMKARGLAFKKP